MLASDDPDDCPRVLHVEAEDTAAVVARLVARPVVASALAREDWKRDLELAGLGPDYARLIVELMEVHNAGRIDIEPSGAVRHGPTELADVLGALVTTA